MSTSIPASATPGAILWKAAIQEHRLPASVGPAEVPRVVDAILAASQNAGASDVHLVPEESGLAMWWRIDGVLHPVSSFPREVRSNLVARLKVLSDLLTYQTDVPQEGRIVDGKGAVEIRVSTFPTVFGEKAVVRLFAASGRLRTLDDLGLPDDVRDTLRLCLSERGGLVLTTGPAGSGKTTTAYACLREITQRSDVPRSVVTLEDPVESIVEGTAQSQVRSAAGFTYEAGMRSLLRQDPDVVLVGEIRDPGTAQSVFQAALTGHLILTTFHAGSAAESIGRLFEMGIEPYQLRSAVRGVLNQRLLRRLCRCASPATGEDAFLGLEVGRAFVPVGCPECRNTGYRGRLLVCELLSPDPASDGVTLAMRSGTNELERLAVAAGMKTRWSRAGEAVSAGLTSPAEVRRAFGFRGGADPSR